MDEEFDSFNAPQFVDFNKASEYFDDSMDTYFDADHETEYKNGPNPNSRKDNLPDSTSHNDKELDPLDDSYDEIQTHKMRKSMSVGNLVLFNEEEYTPYLENIGENLQKLNISNHEDQPKPTLYDKYNIPYKSGTNSLQRKRSQIHLNKLAQPKCYASQENLTQGRNINKFISLAEAVSKFQNGTPTRFRSKPKLVKNSTSESTLFRTVPESPALKTKTRNRPVNVLSREEQEKIDFENQQKFKIKAHPVNKKILHGPIKPAVIVEKKPTTVPKPFKLTSAPPKKVMPSPQKYEFHARPVPRSVEKPKKVISTEKQPCTKPKTPTFMKNYKMPMHKLNPTDSHDGERKSQTNKPRLTKPEPFSFENRDKMIQKKREQLLNKILEEERKAREFQAQPVPKSIHKKSDSLKTDMGSSRSSSKYASTENLTVQFKAKPPVVLYKEPFVPAKVPKPLTEIKPFDLNTEQRAQEREEFEKERREKEERLKYFRKIEEEDLKKQEQEEVLRMRREAEYKAKPIRKYKEVIIQPSNKVTEPISPKFQTDILRQKKQKENVPYNSNT